MGGKVGENPAALRAAVFSLSSKNLRGGAFKRPPPAGRGLNPPSVLSKQKTGRCLDVTMVLRHTREIFHFKIGEL